jgi:hypothetical protein
LLQKHRNGVPFFSFLQKSGGLLRENSVGDGCGRGGKNNLFYVKRRKISDGKCDKPSEYIRE